MTNLTTEELNAALNKIRSRYNQLTKDFGRSAVLSENFENRYMNAIRSRQNIEMFVLGEIEAVEELYKREGEKKKQLDEERKAKSEQAAKEAQKKQEAKTIADRIAEENLAKMRKYPALDIKGDAVEDITRLLGAVRQLINDYYPAVNVVFRNAGNSVHAGKVAMFYNVLMSDYDYKGDVPIARRYCDIVSRRPVDRRKADYEYRYVLQETAFLLNDIHEVLSAAIKSEEIPTPVKKIVIAPSSIPVPETYKSMFNGKKYSEAVIAVDEFVEQILSDFRINGFKRS